MVDPKQNRHPDLDVLADYAAGVLGQEDNALLESHLTECYRCRLEIKRLARFESIDGDEELLAEAGWSEARFALERAYREKVKPAVGAEAPTGPNVARPRANQHWRWLVPVAAAAVLALVFVGLDRDRSAPLSELPGGRDDQALRGGVVQEAVIVLTGPVGEVAESPSVFTWDVHQTFDTFNLEVVTPDLNVVFKQVGIDTTRFDVPDSLRALLQVGGHYLWSVEGRTGLAASEMSETAWFTIVP